MKINKYLVVISILITTLLVACNEYEDTVELSPVVASDNPAVRFSSENPANFVIQPEDLNFLLEVKRSDTSQEIEVPITVVKNDSAVFNVPASVTFAAGAADATIEITIDESVEFDTPLVLAIQLDESFANPYKNEYSYLHSNVTVLAPCFDNKVQLNMVFDGYASETTWDIKDESGEIILEGGPYKDGDVSKSFDFCIVEGTYTFTVYDQYGDGLSYPNIGEVSLSANGEALFSIVGDFGKSQSETFTFGE